MGTVYKKSYTKPLLKGAELFTRKGQRFARWKDSKGRKRTAKLTVGGTGSDGSRFRRGHIPPSIAMGRDVLWKSRPVAGMRRQRGRCLSI